MFQHSQFASLSNSLPFLQDVCGLFGEAIDAPVGVAVLVANSDAETAVVSPNDLDGLVLSTRYVHGLALAPVVRTVSRSVRSLA